MEVSQDPNAADVPLRSGIALILNARPGLSMEDAEIKADAIMAYLHERGHYLPGFPPAQKILDDAKSFAERLTLSNLALRILNMLAWSKVETPETKPARKWIDDYLEGRNHGPVGHPMLWPDKLPGMAHLLRDWGFVPTPTRPAFVSRALPTATMQ